MTDLGRFFDRSHWGAQRTEEQTTAQRHAGLRRRFEELAATLDKDASAYGIRLRYIDDVLDEFNAEVRGS